MDHVVYLDTQAKELELILSHKKQMILRGATGRKVPYGRVNPGDILYFIKNNAEGLIRAKARVEVVINSEQLTPEESAQMVTSHQDKLQLTPKQYMRWTGKRYLVLIEISRAQEVEAFPIDKSEYGNMDDWLPVGDIDQVRIKG